VLRKQEQYLLHSIRSAKSQGMCVIFRFYGLNPSDR